MTERTQCYRVEYQNFARQKLVKHWKERSLGAIHAKLREQPDCAGGVRVKELTPEQYEAEAKVKTRKHPGRWIYNGRGAAR